MTQEVFKVARGYLDKRDKNEEPERTVTFSIRLTEGQHAKLKFLAERFEAPKSPVAQRLLNAAMDEALRTLGTHDALGDQDRETIPVEERNRIINEQVKEYYPEIRRIFDEDVARAGQA